MIKLVYCITKRASLTDEEFFRYLKNTHDPIGARIPGLRRLVQSHRITVPGDKNPSDYDGMAKLWFEDAEALLVARQSLEWRTSSDDEANFIDHKNGAYFVTEEHIIMEQEGQSILKEENRRPEAGHKPVENFCIASCWHVTMPLVQRQSG